jgi:hypothetical protein
MCDVKMDSRTQITLIVIVVAALFGFVSLINSPKIDQIHASQLCSFFSGIATTLLADKTRLTYLKRN